MSIGSQLDTFHKTRMGLLVVGLLELAVAYWLGNLAINSGAWWEWLIVLILLVGALQNLIKLISRFFKKK